MDFSYFIKINQSIFEDGVARIAISASSEFSLKMKHQCYFKNQPLQFITLMLKSYKSSLQLNSYKIDTTTYEEKLHSLTQENEQLKSAIHQMKSKENRLIEELRSTKQQNNSLRDKIRAQAAQLQANCRNCSKLQHQLRELQGKLNNELNQESEKVRQYKQMYENQLQNKKSTAQYYQKKLHSLLRDKDVLIKRYEDKIKIINSQLSLKTEAHLDSTTTIDRFFSPKKGTVEQTIQQSKVQRSPPNKLPPPPPSSQRINQHKQNPQSQKVVKPKKASEQELEDLLIPFLQRLQKMNLTLKELKWIQQIDRFSQAGIVAKNRFIKLMREFPFECTEENLIQLSYEFIVTTLRNNRLEETGANIIEFLMNRLASLEQQHQQEEQE